MSIFLSGILVQYGTHICVLLFLTGLVILLVRRNYAVISRREVGKFADSLERDVDWEVKRLAPEDWPELLRPLAVAVDAATRAGVVPDLDTPVHSVAGRLAHHGGWLRPLASTLIIVSLLGTFAGLRASTESLGETVKSLRDDASEQAKNTGVDEKTAVDPLNAFMGHVEDALTAMSAAFGTNLFGIFFAAMLVVLLPLLRETQRELLDEVRTLISTRIRPRVEQSVGAQMSRAVSEESARVLSNAMNASMGQFIKEFRDVVSQVRDLNAELNATLPNILAEANSGLLANHGENLRDLVTAAQHQNELTGAFVASVQNRESRDEAVLASFHAVTEVLKRIEGTGQNELNKLSEATGDMGTVVKGLNGDVEKFTREFGETITATHQAMGAVERSISNAADALNFRAATLAQREQQAQNAIEASLKALDARTLRLGNQDDELVAATALALSALSAHSQSLEARQQHFDGVLASIANQVAALGSALTSRANKEGELVTALNAVAEVTRSLRSGDSTQSGPPV